jgi:predicted patatin/cPLA2 family phospholipase
LEGGAMRGLFSAGVLDVMMEEGLEYEGAVGVSAGAVFGCNYKSHQPGRVLRYNRRFCKDPRYCSVRSLVKTGDLYGADFCYNVLPNQLDVFDVETYRTSPMDFYVVCADAETGKAVYHNCTKGDAEDLTWIRASASMPLASHVVEVGGYKLLDGGMADSIPLRFLESQGYDRIVVVLTQPMGYVKEKNKALPMMRLALRKYPRLVDTMARRQEVYNETTAYIREKERKGEIFVLRPEAPLPVGKVEHDPEKLQLAYDLGRGVAQKRLAALKDFLK